MRFRAAVVVVGCSLATGCGQQSQAVPAGTSVGYSVVGQAESRACQSPVTRESTCTVTMTAQVELGELEGREWHIRSLESIVRDGRAGQDLAATPRVLTSEAIERLAGSSAVPAHGHLSIPLVLQFKIGQAPFYIDGPHELQVQLFAVVSDPAAAATAN
jgi:hypothetical protein